MVELLTMKNTRKILFSLVLAICFGLSSGLAYADTALDPQLNTDQLQNELKAIEKQIAEYEKQLTQIKGQKDTLTNKIKQLKAKQQDLTLQIKATNLKIADLNRKIGTTKSEIVKKEAKNKELEIQISEYIRQINKQDHNNLVYKLLNAGNFSDVFREIQDNSQVSAALDILLAQVRNVKAQLQTQKKTLETQQADTNDLLAIKILQQQELGNSLKDQDSLLSKTKGKEANYQSVLSDTQKKAAQIRTRIYDLLGINVEITFGQVLQIAQWVSKQTGMRPEFLLAIVTQESNLGRNVGTCNRLGDPPEKSYKVIMKPDRDIEPFVQVTRDLKRDPNITPVSCPMRDKNGARIGWGGAMGPAQFIPSTWLGYKDKVAAVTGKTADPWDIRDAFLAAAIKLKAGGADGTYTGEWSAAMRYFSGSTNTRFRFYGDNVMALAQKYSTDIAALSAK